jgi:hypothetical protein
VEANRSVFYVSHRRCDSERSDLDRDSLGKCIKETDCKLACEINPSNGSADNAENSKRDIVHKQTCSKY